MTSLDSPVVSREGRYLTDAQRLAIVTAVSSGMSHSEVAQHFSVHRVTVSKIMTQARRATNDALGGDWKALQTKRAIVAVDAGLDHTDDPYKRADLGVKVLTGLQVYKPAESSSVTNVFVASIHDLPQDWQERMRRIIDPHAPQLPAETED